MPDVTQVSTISRFNMIIFFHLKKGESPFSCVLLPNIDHGDVCLVFRGSGLKGICFFIFLSLNQQSREKVSKRNKIQATYVI